MQPASLAFAEDGTPFSTRYGDIYHSTAGGIGQAGHVFLRGNGLPGRWTGQDSFTILETGFGTGLNFLVSWRAWRDCADRPRRLHFISAEKHPFQHGDLMKLHQRWPEFASLSAELLQQWPVLTPGFHRLELDAGRVILTLLFGDAALTLPNLLARVDAFFLDGFNPAANPDLWSPQIFKTLAKLAMPSATLATWTVAGQIRHGLREAGFVPNKQPGFGPKREMLVAHYAPPDYRRGEPTTTPPAERTALVIGAGLAGTACCERLAARGWQVTLLERHAQPAQEASGNLAGIAMPLVSRDDNIPSRLSRAAFLHSVRLWRNMDDSGYDFPHSECGVAQLARDSSHAIRQAQLVEEMGYPNEFIRFADQNALSTLTGTPVTQGGWLFPMGGWVNPPGLCQAYLDRAGDRVTPIFDRAVQELKPDERHWLALDSSGYTIARAAHVILATGTAASAIYPDFNPPMQRIRGQVTLVPAGVLPKTKLALCREGYLTPAYGGWQCLGASYDQEEGTEAQPMLDIENWQRLQRLLAGLPDVLPVSDIQNRIGFRAVAPDRLPLVGDIADLNASTISTTQPGQLNRVFGLHSALGYASRGLVWSGLMAELLVSRLEGECLPIEADLANAVDPGRFLLKALRRGVSPA